MKKVLLGLGLMVALFSCSQKIDGTNMITYKSSLEEIKSGFSKSKSDSLQRSISVVIEEDGGFLNIPMVLNRLNGMSASNIFDEANIIIERNEIEEKNKLDSLNKLHITDSIAKALEYEKMGNWKVNYFVDEFKEETKSGYVSQETKGSFSNSATDNNKLSVNVLVTDKEVLQLFLFEYGSSKVKATVNDMGRYSIKVKDSSTDSIVYDETILLYSDRFIFEDKEFFNILKKNKEVKVYIKELSKYSGSTYLFKLDPNKLDNALVKLSK